MFTKKDLKDRMIVETRDGCRYIVVGDLLLSDDGFLRISEYDDILLDNHNGGIGPIFDIMKVFEATDTLSVLTKDKSICLKVLFDRDKNNNEIKAKRFCKQLSDTYSLDESNLYNYFLKILHVVSSNEFSVTDFDIEKCSEADIGEAMRAVSRDCSTFYIIKNMEKD